MTQTLLVPGLHGSGPDHWQDWWARTQERAVIVAQANWERPILEAWGDRLVAAIRRRPGALIVGHSLGCILLAQLAWRDPTLPIAGALLVAPADVEDAGWTPPALRAFGPIPRARLPFPSLVVASRNDPCMGFERAAALAAGWGAGLVDYGLAGHINVASGFGPWPEGPALLDRLEAPPAHDGLPRLHALSSLTRLPVKGPRHDHAHIPS